MFGVSGRFPQLYAGCVMMGQAFGGVVPAVTAVLMITFDVQPKLLGPAAFGAVIVLLALALFCERWLSKNKYFLYFAEGKDNHITGDTSDHDAEVDKLCYRDLLKRSWVYLVGGSIVYATTLSIFPALTSLGNNLCTAGIQKRGLLLRASFVSVDSTRTNGWTEKYFTPVACILLFNVSDLTGRILATYLHWPGRSSKGQMIFFAIAILRISLIPMFMLCNGAPTARSLPVVFYSDTVFCLLIVCLGVSVGYLGNLCLIQAPKTSDMAESQEATSLLLTAFFVLGQASGSFGSFFVMKSM